MVVFVFSLSLHIYIYITHEFLHPCLNGKNFSITVALNGVFNHTLHRVAVIGEDPNDLKISHYMLNN